MRRLIICADGTWNRPDQSDHGASSPTNVVKMQRAILAVDDEGTSQVVYYHSGVGTGNKIDRVKGGAFGDGLDRNIIECYEFLVNNFTEGDELYFFGFSRGAYTVRSLAGLIRNSGLLKQEHAAMVNEAFSLYRDRDPAKHPTAQSAVAFRAQFSHDPVAIKCVGVWDTVGALGIPIGIFDKLNYQRFAFHDVTLSSRVLNAFQALAIDERRRPFQPTLWVQPGQDAVDRANWLEQAWFVGVHSNVGGGYSDTGLSDVAFKWMVERVTEKTDLKFNASYIAQLARPNELGLLQDSMNDFYRVLGEFERQIDQDRAKNEALGVHTWEYVHESVKTRRERTRGRHDQYDPENLAPYASRNAPPPIFSVRRIPVEVGDATLIVVDERRVDAPMAPGVADEKRPQSPPQQPSPH